MNIYINGSWNITVALEHASISVEPYQCLEDGGKMIITKRNNVNEYIKDHIFELRRKI